jgi:hypothetical protein
MPRTGIIIAAVLAALLAPGIASAQDEATGEAGDAGAAAEPSDADAGAEEPVLEEPFVPVAPSEPLYEEDQPAPPEEDVPDGKPFAKGDMEPGLGLGFAGYSDTFYLIIAGSFAYYVVNRFAPGLEVHYGTDFGSAGIPDSVTLLPFVKFVILRSARFAPYLIALGGREFQFAGDYPAQSWIVGGGAGFHIGFGAHVAIKIQLTFQHHWFDDPKVQRYDDAHIVRDADGQEYYCQAGDCPVDEWDDDLWQGDTYFVCEDAANPTPETCAQPVSDRKDLTHQWIFPIISLGASFVF